jgi:hypothetical protein
MHDLFGVRIIPQPAPHPRDGAQSMAEGALGLAADWPVSVRT